METGTIKMETGRANMETGKEKMETAAIKIATRKEKVETGRAKIASARAKMESAGAESAARIVLSADAALGVLQFNIGSPAVRVAALVATAKPAAAWGAECVA